MECKPPLVQYDCYRKRCEPTCSTLGAGEMDPMGVKACPPENGVCFPGCYCPEGTLRKGDTCVSPSQCLDCEYRRRCNTFCFFFKVAMTLFCFISNANPMDIQHESPMGQIKTFFFYLIRPKLWNVSFSKETLIMNAVLGWCRSTGSPADLVSFEGDVLPFLGNCSYIVSSSSKYLVIFYKHFRS